MKETISLLNVQVDDEKHRKEQDEGGDARGNRKTEGRRRRRKGKERRSKRKV